MKNRYTSQAEEVLDLYYEAVTKIIEQKPEFKDLCEAELNKVLKCFPSEVAEHLEKMRSVPAMAYLGWAHSRKDELEQIESDLNKSTNVENNI